MRLERAAVVDRAEGLTEVVEEEEEEVTSEEAEGEEDREVMVSLFSCALKLGVVDQKAGVLSYACHVMSRWRRIRRRRPWLRRR